MDRGSNYHAYLLRLWRENDQSPWRLTLQDSKTGERVAFTNLENFTQYLEDKTNGRLIDFNPGHL